jgi:hypothetical protein
VALQSTRQIWAAAGPFEQYQINGRPQRNVPSAFLKEAVWQVNNGVERYYAKSHAPEESGLAVWYPVEFNFEHICWVEVRWVEPITGEAHWQAFRIAGEDLHLDITTEDVTEQDRIENEQRARLAAAITAYRESANNTPTSRTSTPSSRASVIQIRPSPQVPGSRDQEIAEQLAESLQINRPMSRTVTMEIPVGTINPVTGHMENADDLALHRAIGPDQPDPPSSAGRSRSEPPRIPFGWPRGGPPYQGPPGGGFGGPPGGGGPFGGPPGGGGLPGGAPMPMPAAPAIPAAPHDSKLVGNPPIIFKGEKSQAEEFITQWELYEGVNINNTLMRNAYQRAMLFLTYIQGPLVNEWVKGVNAWLRNQITSHHWATNDERLWDSTIGAFNRQYADVLEQEKAQAELSKGLQLKNGDLDALITQFETLVRHANYDVNQPLVLQIFTNALPHAMYGYIINHVKPRDYEGWRAAAIQQQTTWVHMKSRLNRFARKPQNQPTSLATGGQATNGDDLIWAVKLTLTPWTQRQIEFEDDSQMLKISSQEEVDMKNATKAEEEEVYHRVDKGKSLPVTIATKSDTLHEIVDNQSATTTTVNPGPSRTRQGHTNEDNYYAARSIVDDRSNVGERTPQQKAHDWLSGVAEENDEVKDLVMQELWKKEDFQNA